MNDKLIEDYLNNYEEDFCKVLGTIDNCNGTITVKCLFRDKEETYDIYLFSLLKFVYSKLAV